MKVRECPKCVGCPLFGDGSQTFVPDQIVDGAPVLLVAQTPEESRSALPKIEKSYLPLAGLTRNQVSVSHAVRCTVTLPAPVSPAQFEGGKRGLLEHGVRFCGAAHSPSVHGARLVVTQGDLALYSATGQRSAFDWRGYALPYKPLSDSWMNSVWTPGPKDLPVLATLRLADLFGQPQLAYPTMADWRKIRWFLEGKWPKKPPEVTTTPDAQMFASPAAWDTEWNPSTGQFLRFSVATEEGRVYVIEWQGPQTMSRVWGGNVPHFQGVSTVSKAGEGRFKTSGLVPELRSGDSPTIPVLQSLYSDDNNMSPGQETLVQGTVQAVFRQSTRAESQAVSTYPISPSKRIQPYRGAILRNTGSAGWQMCRLQDSVRSGTEAAHRPLSQDGTSARSVVQSMQPCVRASGRQLRDDSSFSNVYRTVVIGQNIIVDLPNLSRVFPVGSVIEIHDEMLVHSVLWSDLPHSLDFLASIYSPINRHKHLYNRSPIQYAGMDAYVQLKVWEALVQELEKDPQSKAIYEEEMIPLWPTILEAQEVGLKLDQGRVAEALQYHAGLQQEVSLEAEAYTGFNFNLGSPEQVSRWLYEVERVGVKRGRNSRGKGVTQA